MHYDKNNAIILPFYSDNDNINNTGNFRIKDYISKSAE